MKKVVIIQKSLVKYRLPFFNQLRASLAKQDIELTLIYGKIDVPSEFQETLKRELAWGEHIPSKIIKIGPIEFLWQPCLSKLKDKDIVIVEQANKLLLNYYLIFSKYFSRSTFCFWGHGRDHASNPQDWRNKFKYFFIRSCDWWFAYTSSVKDFLRHKNYPSDRITSVQNSIDTSELRMHYKAMRQNSVEIAKKKLGIEGNHVAIFCGTMYAEKRIPFILESCNIIRQSVPDFNMIFIGSGPDSEMARKASIENSWIHYLGPKFDYDRVIYFKMAHLQLMPSAVGLGILDSFAMETPLVTTIHHHHGPEIVYLFNNQNGSITANKPSAYAERIIQLFLSDAIEPMKERCRYDATKYTMEKMVKNFENGILGCLAYKSLHKAQHQEQ